MADFTVRISSGVNVVDWVDAPAGEDLRINPRQGRPLKRYLATVGSPVEVKMAVDGVEDLPDSALDGRPFIPFMVECPWPRPAIISYPGMSSLFGFTPLSSGHYHFRVRRESGGIWHVHLDAAV